MDACTMWCVLPFSALTGGWSCMCVCMHVWRVCLFHHPTDWNRRKKKVDRTGGCVVCRTDLEIQQLSDHRQSISLPPLINQPSIHPSIHPSINTGAENGDALLQRLPAVGGKEKKTAPACRLSLPPPTNMAVRQALSHTHTHPSITHHQMCLSLMYHFPHSTNQPSIPPPINHPPINHPPPPLLDVPLPAQHPHLPPQDLADTARRVRRSGICGGAGSNE